MDNVKFGLTQKQFDLINDLLISIDEVEKAIIFGSRSTDKFKPSSDIDLAIVGNNINHRIINKLASELDELPLPFMFDVIDYTQISNDKLKAKIDLKGKLFFERQFKIV